MFATVSSCLTWTTTTSSNWSGPALWYSSIVFAIGSIFIGAIQSLALPAEGLLYEISDAAVEQMRQAYVQKSSALNQASPYALVVWQMPIMLLGYSVLSYLIGLCIVIISPLVQNPHWNDDAKVWTSSVHSNRPSSSEQTATMFSSAALLGLLCWIASSAVVPRVRVKVE